MGRSYEETQSFDSRRDLKKSGGRPQHHHKLLSQDPFPSTSSFSILTANVGSILYTSPEVLRPGKIAEYGSSADIYSLGMTFWALGCRNEPYPNARSKFEVEKLILEGVRPDWSCGDIALPEEFIELVNEMWDQEMENRPTIDQVIER